MIKIEIPNYVQKVLKGLESAGFKAFIVGGCVRDSIMGKKPADWDVCTSARPEQVMQVFNGIMPAIPTGIKHGTITILSDKIPIEVTTFRIDGNYSDNRRPDSVGFVSDITEDLARRDFTINSMAYNNDEGLVDPFGGGTDIKRGVIRCVGEPEKRFSEDALRIIRALRFAAVCGFKIEDKTETAVREMAENLREIAMERVYAEFRKLLSAEKPAGILIKYRDVFEKILPECFGLERFDAGLCTAIDKMPENFVLRLAAVCASAGEKINPVMHRLKADSKTIRRVCRIVENNKTEPPATKTDVLNFLHEFGVETAADIAEFRIFTDKNENSEQWNSVLLKIRRAADDNECYSLAQLDINGSDLMKCGIKGRRIGMTLDRLLAAVISGKCQNSKVELLEFFNKNCCFLDDDWV